MGYRDENYATSNYGNYFMPTNEEMAFIPKMEEMAFIPKMEEMEYILNMEEMEYIPNIDEIYQYNTEDFAMDYITEIAYECNETDENGNKVCGAIIYGRKKFQTHKMMYHGKKVTVCKSCNQYFPDLSSLFLHAREMHGQRNKVTSNKKHRCVIGKCSYQTDNGGLFKHHMRSHTNYKPYECSICFKTFSQKSNMKTHFNRHKQGEVVCHCQPCDKCFYSQDIYLSHLETREHFLSEQMYFKIITKYKCMCCSMIFASPAEVMEHSSICHFYLMNTEVIACEKCFCGLYPDISILEEHTKKHRNEFTCPLCSERFTDKIKFNFHLTKAHAYRVNRRSACRYCEQVFNSIEDRKSHVEKTHKDEKNRHTSRNEHGRKSCPICQTFTTNSQILYQKHMKSHDNSIDIDQLYKPEAVTVKRESIQEAPTQRRRGRPRICEISYDNEGINMPQTQLPIAEHKKKRGRPSKTTNKSPSESSVTNLEGKKRGRPRKMKTESQFGAIDYDITVLDYGSPSNNYNPFYEGTFYQ